MKVIPHSNFEGRTDLTLETKITVYVITEKPT